MAEAVGKPGRACPICEQALGCHDRCRNAWCTRADRWFSSVWCVSIHTGALRRAIASYKYRTDRWWAEVFGRVLVGFLDEHMPWFDGYDFLAPTPAYGGPGARRDWDHIGEIVAAASRLAGHRWPVQMGLVTKSAETPPMTGQPWPARRARAEGPLRRALRVPDPALVLGRRVLVIDDVFTEGSTLREVARALMLAGAHEVAGLALARQPWRSLGSPSRRVAVGYRRLAA